MSPTLLDVIREQVPEIKQWDGWDYKVWAPVSLDDVGSVIVVFKNQNQSKIEVELELKVKLHRPAWTAKS